ncbi:S8 family serine peptidase [Mycoplasma sp. 21DD0573]|uniref:S8 family serine peptidase n=1 Tax=unclassified Mycoplasma TaxID=2683645 RepID=UPI002B1DB9B9|nr:S8 family serine peptidase [Mycoplasma sp. 21DD0573]MEA4276323.1 S8 family serine peptidase [Mycoplasma sp. 21DD0573]
MNKIKKIFQKLLLPSLISPVIICSSLSVSAKPSSEEFEEMVRDLYDHYIELENIEEFNKLMKSEENESPYLQYFQKLGISDSINKVNENNDEKTKIGIIELGLVNPWLFLQNDETSDNLKLYLPKYSKEEISDKKDMEYFVKDSIDVISSESFKKMENSKLTRNMLWKLNKEIFWVNNKVNLNNNSGTLGEVIQRESLENLFSSHATTVASIMSGHLGILKNAEIHSASLNMFNPFSLGEKTFLTYYDHKTDDTKIINQSLGRTPDYFRIRTLDSILRKMLSNNVKLINMSFGGSTIFEEGVAKNVWNHLNKLSSRFEKIKAEYNIKNFDELYMYLIRKGVWNDKLEQEDLEMFLEIKHIILWYLYTNERLNTKENIQEVLKMGYSNFCNWDERNQKIEKLEKLLDHKYSYAPIMSMIDSYAFKYNMKFFIAAGNDEEWLSLLRICDRLTYHMETNSKLRKKLDLKYIDSMSANTNSGKNVIYVGSMNPSGYVSRFSQQGSYDKGDFPLIINYGELNNLPIETENRRSENLFKLLYKDQTGTSFATPMTTGTIALLEAESSKIAHNKAPRDWKAALASSSRYIWDLGARDYDPSDDPEFLETFNALEFEAVHSNNSYTMSGFGSIKYKTLKDVLENEIWVKIPDITNKEDEPEIVKIPADLNGCTIHFFGLPRNKIENNSYREVFRKGFDEISRIVKLDISEFVKNKNSLRVALSWDFTNSEYRLNKFKEKYSALANSDITLYEIKKELVDIFDLEVWPYTERSGWHNDVINSNNVKKKGYWNFSTGTDTNVECVKIDKIDFEYAEKLDIRLITKTKSKFFTEEKYELIKRVLAGSLLTVTISAD